MVRFLTLLLACLPKNGRAYLKVGNYKSAYIHEQNMEAKHRK